MAITKEALQDRRAIVDAIPEDDLAMDALADWHKENPGYKHEAHIPHLRHFLSSTQSHSPELLRRSVHAHLTGRRPLKGDLVRTNSGRGLLGVMGEPVTDSFGSVWVTLDKNNTDGLADGFNYRNLVHEASAHVRRRQAVEASQGKAMALEEIWKCLQS